MEHEDTAAVAANTYDRFESATTEFEEFEIQVRGDTLKYRVHDITAAQSEDIFGSVLASEGVDKRQAIMTLRMKLIAASITRADGTAFTEEQVAKMRNPVVTKLAEKAMQYTQLGGEAAKKS